MIHVKELNCIVWVQKSPNIASILCKISKFLYFFDAVYQKKELNQYLLFANVEGHAEILQISFVFKHNIEGCDVNQVAD